MLTAPEAYKQARDLYAEIQDTEQKVLHQLALADEQLAKATTLRPDLIAEAQEIVDRLIGILQSVRRIKVETMGVYVGTIGQVLQSVQSARAKLDGTAVADNLGQFDLDLSRLQERFDKLYAPFFKFNKDWSFKVDVTWWGPVEWDKYYRFVEGPVLLWQTVSECAEKWKAIGVPSCHGPDYLRAWILAGQSEIASESYIHSLDAISKFMENFVYEITKTLIDTVAGIAEGVVLGALKGALKATTERPLFPVVLAGGAALLALILLSPKSRRKK